ncbi:MAG: (d)CMP kinase [Pseudomonadota bacterium]
MGSNRDIITIDGPAGAGKTTVARGVAKRLGWTYLDTGAMYRAAALAAFEKGTPFDDEPGMTRLLEILQLEILPGPEGVKVIMDGQDVTALIRRPQVSGLASAVAAQPVVRRAMVDLQKKIGASGRLVADGRDMGTVVFPEARVKVFLTASLEIRSERRYLELSGMGEKVMREAVEKDMAARDYADSTRKIARLRPAADAVLIDAGLLSPEEVIDQILAMTT